MQHKFNIFADIFFTKKKTEETERKKKNTQWGFLNYLKPTTDLKKKKKKIKPRNSLSSLEKQKTKKTLTAKLGPSRFYFS